MIYLTCKKIPDGTTAVELYEKALTAFKACPENTDYIEQIYSRCDKSAIESLFALCVLAELTAHVGNSPDCEQITLARTDSGKPYFIDGKWQFNISHSGEYVAVALCDDGAVGIDIETAHITAKKAQDLAKRFFTEQEQRTVATQPESFCEIWSKKEATAKHLGIPLGQFLKSDKEKFSKDELSVNKLKTQSIKLQNVLVTVCTDTDSSEIIVVP